MCVCSKTETYKDGGRENLCVKLLRKELLIPVKKTLNQNHFTATFREPFAFFSQQFYHQTQHSKLHISDRNIPPL